MKQNHLDLRDGNIILAIDSYDDIFSDFDPGEYKVKALSNDFLAECKIASKDKKDGLELIFLMAKNKRKKVVEAEIIKRLTNHFQRHYDLTSKEIKHTKQIGVSWFFAGAVIMLFATFLTNYQGFIISFLETISEPAGWFMFWEGLSKVFIEVKKELPEHEFYKKLSKSKIIFANK